MPPMSDHNAGSRGSPRTGVFLDQSFTFGVIGSDLMLGERASRPLVIMVINDNVDYYD